MAERGRWPHRLEPRGVEACGGDVAQPRLLFRGAHLRHGLIPHQVRAADDGVEESVRVPTAAPPSHTVRSQYRAMPSGCRWCVLLLHASLLTALRDATVRSHAPAARHSCGRGNERRYRSARSERSCLASTAAGLPPLLRPPYPLSSAGKSAFARRYCGTTGSGAWCTMWPCRM
jgi:hypothetical protein